MQSVADLGGGVVGHFETYATYGSINADYPISELGSLVHIDCACVHFYHIPGKFLQ